MTAATVGVFADASDNLVNTTEFSIVGIASSDFAGDSAGILAKNYGSGPDLILGDSSDFEVPARLYQEALSRDSATDTSFRFENSDLGVLNLKVEGGLTTHTSSRNLEITPFYVKLTGDGSTQDIATNGTLRVFVRCLVGASSKTVQVIATNTAAGWFDDDHPSGSSYAANQEVVVLQVDSSTFPVFRGDFDEFFVVSPSGRYMAVDGETAALGVGVFGSDCIAAGTLTSLED